MSVYVRVLLHAWVTWHAVVPLVKDWSNAVVPLVKDWSNAVVPLVKDWSNAVIPPLMHPHIRRAVIPPQHSRRLSGYVSDWTHSRRLSGRVSDSCLWRAIIPPYIVRAWCVYGACGSTVGVRWVCGGCTVGVH
jgi:hypothetical protein